MNKTQCKRKIYRSAIGAHTQCRLPAVRDGWCRVHHPDAIETRYQKQRARAEAKSARRPPTGGRSHG